MLGHIRGRKFSSITAHKLSLQTGVELEHVTTQEMQKLIPSTVLKRILLAACTYIAQQGLNLAPAYAGCDVAADRGDMPCWEQEQTLPLVSNQMGQKQGRVYDFYEPFPKKGSQCQGRVRPRM